MIQCINYINSQLCYWSAYENNLYIIYTNDHDIYIQPILHIASAYDLAHSLFVEGGHYKYLHMEKFFPFLNVIN